LGWELFGPQGADAQGVALGLEFVHISSIFIVEV